jgi:hypothetical protein
MQQQQQSSCEHRVESNCESSISSSEQLQNSSRDTEQLVIKQLGHPVRGKVIEKRGQISK